MYFNYYIMAKYERWYQLSVYFNRYRDKASSYTW